MSVFRGAALLLSGGGPISGFDARTFEFWGQGSDRYRPDAGGHLSSASRSSPIWCCATRKFGRQVYAVGGNRRGGAALRPQGAAHPAQRLRADGVLLGARGLRAGGPAELGRSGWRAIGYELTVIASVVIGGTSLFGGVGTIFGTVIGAVLIGVLLNGLVLLNVSSYIQQIVIGLIIVLAVAFDTFAKSRRRRA